VQPRNRPGSTTAPCINTFPSAAEKQVEHDDLGSYIYAVLCEMCFKVTPAVIKDCPNLAHIFYFGKGTGCSIMIFSKSGISNANTANRRMSRI
jgi:hypothetical protein